jgi:hypothetical protein
MSFTGTPWFSAPVVGGFGLSTTAFSRRKHPNFALQGALGETSMLQRIHIIGGPGSGKSYAARQLSRLLGIPAYDLDELFWDRAAPRYGVRATVAERDTRLVAITQEVTWVIEGGESGVRSCNTTSLVL